MYDEWKNIAPYLEKVDEFAMKKQVIQKWQKTLEKVANTISNYLAQKILRKAEKLISERKNVFDSKTLDWAMGELAYGTLLLEGHDIRLSGQDVEGYIFTSSCHFSWWDSEEEIIF